MAISDTQEQVIANCESCGAIVGAKVTDDGSIVPMGSTDECGCGCDQFRLLR